MLLCGFADVSDAGPGTRPGVHPVAQSPAPACTLTATCLPSRTVMALRRLLPALSLLRVERCECLAQVFSGRCAGRRMSVRFLARLPGVWPSACVWFAAAVTVHHSQLSPCHPHISLPVSSLTVALATAADSFVVASAACPRCRRQQCYCSGGNGSEWVEAVRSSHQSLNHRLTLSPLCDL